MTTHADGAPLTALPPYAHQVVALHEKLRPNFSAYALIMEQGCAKSRPIVREFWADVAGERVDGLVLVAPRGCYRNWVANGDEPGEFEKWSTPQELKFLYVFTWTAGFVNTKRGKEALEHFLNYRGMKHRVLLVNVESLGRVKRAEDCVRRFMGSGRMRMVVDESACIMHEESGQTRVVQDLGELAVSRRILSGIIAPETPMNLFSQYWFLDWRILGMRSFFGFRARYAVLKKRDYRSGAQKEADAAKGRTGRRTPVVVGYRNQDELQRKIMEKSYRVLKTDCLDLPEKIYMPIRWVNLTDEQARMYEDMKKRATTELDGHHVTAKIVLDQFGKLHDIVCGHVRDEDGNFVDIPSNRVDEVCAILSDHSGKGIVWSGKPRLLAKIVEALRLNWGEDSVVRFWGEVPEAERQEAKRRIQNDDKCRWIVANQRVGGEGNTWTAATLSVYASNRWENRWRQQSEDRPHRAGQTEHCVYHDIAAQGTIDVRLIKMLREKMDVAGALTGDAWREWLI